MTRPIDSNPDQPPSSPSFPLVCLGVGWLAVCDWALDKLDIDKVDTDPADRTGLDPIEVS